MVEIEKEYLKELEFWHQSALEKTGKKDRDYYDHLIFGWHSGHFPEQDSMLNKLEVSSKEKDYVMMQQIFFTYYKRELSWNQASGYDHCFLIYRAIPYLCCADYDEIYRVFPKGLQLSANGHSMLVNSTALLQCILYKGEYDEQKVITKAEKYIASKRPKWDRAFVACFLAILKEDDVMLSENLQTLCKYHTRQGISSFMKFHCQHAYGLLVFAKHNLSEDCFQKVKLPKHKTFDSGYMEWVFAGKFLRQSIYNYPSPFEVLNMVYEMPLPITVLCQPYFNADYSWDKTYYTDEEAINAQVVDYVMARI